MNYMAVAGTMYKGGLEFKETGLALPKRQERVLGAVMRHYDLTWEQMTTKSRKRKVLVPRQVAMYLLHKILGMGCRDIGNLFHMDHTSAIHTFRLVQGLIEVDEDFRNEIRGIKENIF
jgi:chromosomal replication initiator protein